MTVTSTHGDPEALTMTIECEFEASVERVWQVWANPRQMERWWGPPTYPATVVEHDLAPGGSVTYYMTGAEGDRHWGWWQVISVEAPSLLEIDDGFGEDGGRPSAAMPVTRMVLTLRSGPDGTTGMRLVTTFPSLEAMEQLLSMGMEEGITAALGQIEDILVGTD